MPNSFSPPPRPSCINMMCILLDEARHTHIPRSMYRKPRRVKLFCNASCVKLRAMPGSPRKEGAKRRAATKPEAKSERAARSPLQDPKRPYRMLGREIQSRIHRLDLDRVALARKLDMPRNSLDSVLAGYRPLPADKLMHAADILAATGEDSETVREILQQVSVPDTSRLSLLLNPNSRQPLRIGYLVWPPFVEVVGGHPEGLLVEMMRLLCRLLKIADEWVPLEFHDMLRKVEDGTVDIVVGFVLETLHRRARAAFVPLHLPFRVGLNGITASREFDRLGDLEPEQRYREVLKILQSLSHRTSNPLLVVTVKGELADEYLPAFLPKVGSLKEEENLSIEDALDHYTKSDKYVVCVDHISCRRWLARNPNRNLKLLFKKPVGLFEGGFLLPLDDAQWTAYFERAFVHLLMARLPETGFIMSRHADQLNDLIDAGNKQWRRSFEERACPFLQPTQFLTAEEWFHAYWPKEVPLPEQWKCYAHDDGQAAVNFSTRRS